MIQVFIILFLFIIISLNLINVDLLRIYFILFSLFFLFVYAYKNKNKFKSYIENPGIQTNYDKDGINIENKNEIILFKQLKKYEKYDKHTFKNASKIYKKFKKTLKKFKKGYIINSNNFLNDLYYYLNKSIDEFMKITFTMKKKDIENYVDLLNKIKQINIDLIKNIYQDYTTNKENINYYSGFKYNNDLTTPVDI
jgi:hypothetical protein